MHDAVMLITVHHHLPPSTTRNFYVVNGFMTIT